MPELFGDPERREESRDAEIRGARKLQDYRGGRASGGYQFSSTMYAMTPQITAHHIGEIPNMQLSRVMDLA